VAKLTCRCGYIFTRLPEAGGRLYSWADLEEMVDLAGRGLPYLEIWDRGVNLLRCPNCRTLSVETEDRVDYEFFVPQTELPRIYADRSVTDALGGYGLDSERSLADIQSQRLLLGPSLEVTAYDESGWEAYCSIEPWVNSDDSFDVNRFVARDGGRL
jgi:hypothetical protein